MRNNLHRRLASTIKQVLYHCLLLAILFFMHTNLAWSTTIDSVLNNVEELPSDMLTIFREDVISYYDLYQEYDTDLKKSLFKKSKEYRDKLKELKDIKRQAMSKYYYIVSDSNIPTYDIKSKSFKIDIGCNWGMEDSHVRARNSINRVLFESLPTKQVKSDFLPDGVYDDILPLQINPSDALTIENNREDIRLYVIFKLTGIKTLKFKFMIDQIWYVATQDVLITESARVLLANTRTKEVYFDKTYSKGRK